MLNCAKNNAVGDITLAVCRAEILVAKYNCILLANFIVVYASKILRQNSIGITMGKAASTDFNREAPVTGCGACQASIPW